MIIRYNQSYPLAVTSWVSSALAGELSFDLGFTSVSNATCQGLVAR